MLFIGYLFTFIYIYFYLFLCTHMYVCMYVMNVMYVCAYSVLCIYACILFDLISIEKKTETESACVHSV